MSERGRRPWAMVGLVVLAVVVAYLCYLALKPRGAAGSTAAGVVLGSASTQPSPATTASSATASATPSSSATASTAPATTGPALPLEMVSASVALRAQPGSCAAGGVALQRSTDGGRTWATVAIPATSIVRLLATSPSSFLAVGTAKDCTPRLYRTADAGRTWAVSTVTKNVWFLPPGSASGAVHAPSGDVRSPCAVAATPVEVSGITLADAVLACSDGTVFRTQDGGTSWQHGAPVPGLVALSAVSSSDVWAASAQPAAGCVGVAVVRSTDGGAAWQPAGCAAGAQPGTVGLSFATGSTGMLWDGNGVWTTGDGGATWLPAGS